MKVLRGLPVFILLISFLFLGNSNFVMMPQDAGYLTMAESMPEPVGGLAAIYKNITEYPKVAKAAGLQGKVFVLAFINENGGVDDAKVVKGIGGGCDEAAAEAVKKTKFKPGKDKGQNVKIKMPLSITFKIEN